MGEDQPKPNPGGNAEAGREAPAPAPAAGAEVKAPPENREAVVGSTAERLSDLRTQVDVDRIQKEIPGFGKDDAAKSQLRDYMSRVVVPGAGWDDLRTKWLNEAITNLKKSPNQEGLEAAFGDKGEPGPFGKWLEKHADKNRLALWQAREQTRGRKEAYAKNDVYSRIESNIPKIPDAFEALKKAAAEFKEKINRTPATALTALESEAKAFDKLLTDALTAHGTFVTAAQGFETLSHGKDPLKPLKADAERLMKVAHDPNTVRDAVVKIDELRAKVDNWKALEEAAKNPSVPAERRDAILEAAKKDGDVEKAKRELDQIIGETEALAAAQSGEEPGLIDSLNGLLASFNLRIENPTLNKAMLKLATALAALPFIGKVVRSALFSRTGLLRMARAAGDHEAEARYATEVNAFGRIRKYGLSAALTEQLMDLNVDSFRRIQPATLTKDPAQRDAIIRLQQNFAASGLANNPKDPVWKIVGSPQWTITPSQTPPATPEKTPVQKTDDLLATNFGFTPDQREKVKTLTVAGVLKGEAVYPEGTPDDKKAKLKGILERNIPESERASVDPKLTVAQFFEKSYQENKPIEGV